MNRPTMTAPTFSANLLGVLSVWGTADPSCDLAPSGKGNGEAKNPDLLEVLTSWGSCDN